MSKKAYYTSNDLIDAVKRDISIPLTQISYTEDDILDFANEELFLEQVPSILEHHEEYLVFSVDQAIVANQSRYDIPDRAIGMKLRDLFYVDTQGNLYALSNVGANNQDFYSMNNSNFTNPQFYYIEGNEVVLVPAMLGQVSGSLRFKFYLRPNSLVLNERAGICTDFVKQITVTNASVTAGDSLTIGTHTLVAGTDFTIGATATATAASISTAIAALNDQDISATAASAIVSVLFQDRNLIFATSDTTAFSISNQLGIEVSSMPENFIEGMYIDFLQTAGGHKTYAYDVRVPRGGVSSSTVFFTDSSVPTKFLVGDYICEAGECIIPQIPSDLHMLLGQRTSARVLQSQGDTEAASLKTGKIQNLESKQATLIDNRTEGSPKKVFNRHSLLRSAKRGRFRRF